MKTCNTCEEQKPLEEYYKRKTTKDGRYGICKSCAKVYAAAKRKADPEGTKQALADWYDKNKEYAKAKAREWQQDNKERRAAYIKLNAAKFAARTAQRRALYKHGVEAMPPEEKAQVDYLYWLAKDLTAVSGECYHVDHIMPLAKGGEHRLHNLQILHAEDNLKKGAQVL